MNRRAIPSRQLGRLLLQSRFELIIVEKGADKSVPPKSLDLFGSDTAAVLMKNCLGHLTLIVFDESHLNIGHNHKEISFRFRNDLSLALTGWLHEKLIALASEDHTEAGSELIFTGVDVKDFRIELNRFVLFRRFHLCQRVLAHEQMTANVVDVVCRVRQHDDTLAVLLVEADERVVSAAAAVVSNNFAIKLFQDVPVETNREIGLASFALRLLRALHGREQRRLSQAHVGGDKLEHVVNCRSQRAGAGQSWQVPIEDLL